MTIEQIRNFLVLEKHMHFSLAADELFLSQSSLSKQIKSLEKELGVTFFERNTRNMELTEAGKLFSGFAHEIMSSYNRMQAEVKQHLEHTDNRLRIFSIPVLNQYNLTHLISKFKQVNPHVNLVISEEGSVRVMAALFAHECDLVIVRAQTVTNKDVKIFPFTEDEIVLVVGKDHPLAKKERVSIKEAAGEDFLLLGSFTGLYNICVQVCEEAGFTPKISGDALGIETIGSFVSHNMGVSMVMKKMAQYMKKFDDNMVIVPLRERPLLTLDIITRDEPLSQSALKFITMAKEFFSGGKQIY